MKDVRRHLDVRRKKNRGEIVPVRDVWLSGLRIKRNKSLDTSALRPPLIISIRNAHLRYTTQAAFRRARREPDVRAASEQYPDHVICGGSSEVPPRCSRSAFV